jgi:hypothetical protein
MAGGVDLLSWSAIDLAEREVHAAHDALSVAQKAFQYSPHGTRGKRGEALKRAHLAVLKAEVALDALRRAVKG